MKFRFLKILIYSVFNLIILSTFQMTKAGESVHINAVSFEFSPYEFINQNGKADGLAVELVQELCRSLDIELTISIVPWARALKNVKEGRVDVIFTAYYTSERADFLNYVNEVIIPQEVSLFTYTSSSLSSFDDILSINKPRLGVRRKISYGSILDSMISNDNFTHIWEVDNDVNLLKLLNSKRLDLVPMNKLVAKYLIQNNKKLLGNIREIKPIITVPDSFIKPCI